MKISNHGWGCSRTTKFTSSAVLSTSDLGTHKVDALNNRLRHSVKVVDNDVVIDPICTNFTGRITLEGYDLVIVAVDREEPRRLVHTNATQWLDLRARGDGFVMWSHLDDFQILNLPPNYPRTNRQVVNWMGPLKQETFSLDLH